MYWFHHVESLIRGDYTMSINFWYKVTISYFSSIPLLSSIYILNMISGTSYRPNSLPVERSPKSSHYEECRKDARRSAPRSGRYRAASEDDYRRKIYRLIRRSKSPVFSHSLIESRARYFPPISNLVCDLIYKFLRRNF